MPENLRLPAFIRISTTTAGLILLFALLATIVVAPMNGEDYGLSLALPHASLPVHLEKVGSFLWFHAMDWNARLGEMLAIIELAMPHAAYASIQGMAAMAFILLISLLARGQHKEYGATGYICVLALAITYLAWPRLEIFFWATVGAGYLQPLVAALWLIWLLADPQRRDRIQHSPLRSAGMGMLALAVGFSFENVGPALVLYMLAAAWMANRANQPGWQLTLAIAFFIGIGWLGLMLTPSTHHRMVFYQQALHVPPWSWHRIVHRMANVVGVFLSVAWPLVLLTAIGLLGIWRHKEDRQDHGDLVLLLLPALLVVGGTILAPYTDPRAFVLPWSIMLCVSLRGIMLICTRTRHFKSLAAAVAILSIPMAFSIYLAYADFASHVTDRSKKILAAAGTPACKQGIYVHPIQTSASTRVLNNREDWVMHALDQVGRYYRCKLAASPDERTHATHVK